MIPSNRQAPPQRNFTRCYLFPFFGLVFSLTLLQGCQKPPKPIETNPPKEKYPQRSGWLACDKQDLTSIPIDWNRNGLHPLAELGLEKEKRSKNAELLETEQKNNRVFNLDRYPHLKDLGGDPRPKLAATLDAFFGTPAAPRIFPAEKDPILKPEIKSQLQALYAIAEELQLAPEILAKGASLYRTNCQTCHGVTGGGDGPAGRYLTPLPRDYRQGAFKFISTGYDFTADKVRARPHRDDLARTIRKGLDGSSMPAFSTLSEADVQALVSYVIHLSIRGEIEYRFLRIVADKKIAEEDPDGDPEALPEFATRQLNRLLKLWRKCNEKKITLEEDPYLTETAKLEAASRGHRLFLENCASCHLGYGRESKLKFDAWGSITKPRNLAGEGYRVGRTPQEIFTRIYEGIPGAGMPEKRDLLATPAEKAEGRSRMWDLVYFVYYLGDAYKRRQLRNEFGLPID